MNTLIDFLKSLFISSEPPFDEQYFADIETRTRWIEPGPRSAPAPWD